MTTKTLILIRHAHRDTDLGQKDNGLSEKGFLQVERLVRFAQKRFKDLSPQQIVFFSSPKLRCQQTVTPVAKQLHSTVTIDPHFDESGAFESSHEILERLELSLDDWKGSSADVGVFCSHGDIIPILVRHLTGVELSLKKSGWIELQYRAGRYELTWLVQKMQ